MTNIAFVRWWPLVGLNAAACVALIVGIRKLQVSYVQLYIQKQKFLYASNKLAGMSGMN